MGMEKDAQKAKVSSDFRLLRSHCRNSGKWSEYHNRLMQNRKNMYCDNIIDIKSVCTVRNNCNVSFFQSSVPPVACCLLPVARKMNLFHPILVQ